METRFVKFLRKATEYSACLLVFALPWQTKLIIRPGATNYTEISLFLSQVILLLVLVFCLYLRIREKGNVDERRPLLCAVAALAFFTLVSVFFAADKYLSAYRYLVFLSGLGLFFVIRFGTAPRNYQDPVIDKLTLVYSLLSGIMLQALLGIYQFLTQSTFACKYLGLASHNPETLGTAVVETADGRWLRAYGGFDHPNILGGVLAISMILAAYMLAKKKMLNTRRQIWSSVFLFGFYFISLYALFFTFSRSAWLALAVGFAILLAVFIAGKDRWILSRFVALVFFSAILIGIIASPFKDLLSTRLQADTRLEQKSLIERKNYIFQAGELLRHSPLSGVGIGNYSTAIALSDNNQKPAWEYQPVHNAFLLLLAESGLFSLLSFLAFVFFLGRSGRREKFAWAALAAVIVLMLFDHWLISLPFGVLFLFLIFGLV